MPALLAAEPEFPQGDLCHLAARIKPQGAGLESVYRQFRRPCGRLTVHVRHAGLQLHYAPCTSKRLGALPMTVVVECIVEKDDMC